MPKSKKRARKLPKIPKGTAAQVRALTRVKDELARVEGELKTKRAWASALKERKSALMKRLVK